MSEYDDNADNAGDAGDDLDDLELGVEVEDTDPALAHAVLEIEEHVAGDGWDRPARLYALVDTATLVAQEPALASLMGLDDAAAQGSLTPIEQDQLAPGVLLEDVLPTIAWPEGVVGCAAVVERLVLPPEADTAIPTDPEEAAEFAASHPGRQEVRIIAGVTRAGAIYTALRLRSHDDAASVVGGADLVPQLTQLLMASLESDA